MVKNLVSVRVINLKDSGMSNYIIQVALISVRMNIHLANHSSSPMSVSSTDEGMFCLSAFLSIPLPSPR